MTVRLLLEKDEKMQQETKAILDLIDNSFIGVPQKIIEEFAVRSRRKYGSNDVQQNAGRNQDLRASA